MDPRTQILRPLQRPRPEFFDLPGGEPVRGVVLILIPFRADESVPEAFEAELVMGATADQGLEIGGGALAGGSLDVDEVADGGAVVGLGRRSPERLLEDVDLARLADVRIGDERAAAQRIGLDVSGPSSAHAEARCE
ncbi:hypothetical protein [Streptomyces sp. NRRL F-5650]|uniref:hypothetical protein n=1 Tax=Streptomyces sp. NRRL F-5650 TaxID=1463868 RepID=UPI0004CA8494|nr:hypothetical protein [Streptomyces sp. NRRL F-5650]